eukprot:scaffold269218_cov30-Tisochrysis_lutea.AAC.1
MHAVLLLTVAGVNHRLVSSFPAQTVRRVPCLHLMASSEHPGYNQSQPLSRSDLNDSRNAPDSAQESFSAEIYEAFEAGKSYGSSLRNRFVAPAIDDPGLPFADALTSISATLLVAGLSLSGFVPPVSWLQKADWMPAWRALPYIPPAIVHGTQLASCWVLGALAANAFEREAFCGGLGTALSRTWRAGAFAIGVLLLGTQMRTYVELTAAGLEPFLGASRESVILYMWPSFLSPSPEDHRSLFRSFSGHRWRLE